jgi:inosine-uridine nucleoside N-ribohydrolase
MAEHRIVLDCDPGVDDAVAIFLAVASPEEIEIVGVTTVAGNCELPIVDRNARRVLAFAGASAIPVATGCHRPIMTQERKTTHVHGVDGLAGIELPPAPLAPSGPHGVDFIIEAVMSAPGEITLCPIGPMTNIALALIKEPRLATSVKEIVFMGGAAFVPGNITPVASFNFFSDPHAAQIVLSCGARLTMFGLDVTRQAKITADVCERVGAGGRISRIAMQMLTGYGSADPSLHDPCVIAHLIDPTLFGGVDALVTVECASPLTMGQSVAARTARNLAGRMPNCRVITEVASDRLFELLASRLARI